MADELNGCMSKIHRANESIQNIHREISALLKSSVYTVARDDDMKANLYRYRALIRQPKANTALVRLSVFAGEIIHHLRSSLDHLAWQLVKKSGIDPTTQG